MSNKMCNRGNTKCRTTNTPQNCHGSFVAYLPFSAKPRHQFYKRAKQTTPPRH